MLGIANGIVRLLTRNSQRRKEEKITRMVAALFLLWLGWVNPSTGAAVNVGEPALTFTLPRLRTDASLTPPPVALQQFFGKIIVLNFWAMWCKPSTAELATLDRLQKKYGPEKLVVLAINVDEAPKPAQQWLKRDSLSVLALHDAQKYVAGIYDVPRLPSSFLIDRHGVVRFIHAGFGDEEARNYELEIDGLLSETDSRMSAGAGK